MKGHNMNKKLYVIGLGPGSEQQITPKAMDAMNESEYIYGYSVYIKLISHLFEEKKMIDTPMRQEIERCRLALQKADEGHIVSIVSSGDPNVYGMSALIYELSVEYPQVQITVVSGITAALSGASLLGAPLSHDFVLISLSDLLTPWELIEKRLEHAALGDFCICLYNPSSMKRKDYLSKACEIILRHRKDDTVCGYVRNIDRENEQSTILTLSELKDSKVDMFTTVFIGNSQTRLVGAKILTPRGYVI